MVLLFLLILTSTYDSIIHMEYSYLTMNEFIVNTDTTYEKYLPVISMDISGNFVICWLEYSDDEYIYGRKYNIYGGISPIFQVANGPIKSYGSDHPSISLSDDGNFVVCWSGLEYIFGKIFSSTCQPITQTFQVTDATWAYEVDAAHSSVSMNSSGEFVVCWEDGRDGWWEYDQWGREYWVSNTNVYAQVYDSSGNPYSSYGNFRVAGWYFSDAWEGYPAVALNDSGRYVICWIGSGNVWFKMFNVPVNAISSDVIVNSVCQVTYTRPAIAIDNNGNFAIVWKGEDGNIYLQQYNSNGVQIGTNIRVNDSPGNVERTNPSIAMSKDGSKIVVAWTEYRTSSTNPDIYAQIYENGIPVGSNFRVNQDDSLANNIQKSTTFSVACNSNFSVITWMDKRIHDNGDIYASLININSTWVDTPNTNQGDNCFEIIPNPFTSTFRVKLYHEISGNHSLLIYNIDGRLLKRTKETVLGRDLPSGIYFIKIEGYPDVKKVIKLKALP